jgi:nicotinamide-nucleotide adenylyltransferase
VEDTIQLELSFLLGLDTLERLFAPRYYPSEAEMLAALRRFLSPAEENSRVVCARRNQPTSVTSGGEKLKLAKEFIDSGRVSMINIGDDESTYSSTAVRNAVKEFGLGEGREKWKKYVSESIADFIEREKLYVG